MEYNIIYNLPYSY